MDKAKILLVDDDRDMCWLISSILKEEGFAVDIAHDGESALAKINNSTYDLTILDYKLSGISGLAVLAKAYEIDPTIEAIMVSAFGNEYVKAQARQLGVRDFLDKPFNIDSLLRVAKKALRNKIRSEGDPSPAKRRGQDQICFANLKGGE